MVEKECVQFTVHNINTVDLYSYCIKLFIATIYALTKFAQLRVSHLEALKV